MTPSRPSLQTLASLQRLPGYLPAVRAVFTVKTAIEAPREDTVSISTLDTSGEAGGFLPAISASAATVITI